MGVDLCGALLVDKPAGPTSHDVVAVVRRAFKTPRIGHTGTLDPLATGLLVLLVGVATRLAQFVGGDEKEYIAEIRLGASTPTYDAASRPSPDSRGSANPAPSAAEIDEALRDFRGTFLQSPPAFSAKKIEGDRAYERARQGLRPELAPVEVTVSTLERLPAIEHPASGIDASLLRLRIAASAGFYVRSLAHDLGERLGCGAHLAALRRVRAGRFSVVDAVTLEAVVTDPAAAERRVIRPGELLEGLPAAALSPRGVVRALHGNSLGPNHVTERPMPGGLGEPVRLFDGHELVGVARTGRDGLLHPVVVLAGPPEVKY